MMGKDTIKILAYLKKGGPTNTYRLAREIGLERNKLLNILETLEEKQAIRFKCGNAIFVKFISEEKPKPTKIKKPSLKPQKRAEKKARPKAVLLLQTENKQLKGKLLELEETVKELEKKANASPKIITKTITKTIIKKVPVSKTIVKKILPPTPPSPRSPKKKEKVKRKKIKRVKKKHKTTKKFKLPKFAFMKNIKQLKKPEFAK